MARLVGAQTVSISNGGETSELSARHILLATGSLPQRLPIAPTDGRQIFDSDQILDLDTVPERLAIFGAGAVGVEFASIFASFGAAVTLIEMLPRILPQEDEEVSRGLERSLARRGQGHSGRDGVRPRVPGRRAAAVA